MADSTSPAFTPPVNSIKDSDPQIMRVPLDKVDFGFRQSAAPPIRSDGFTLNHIPNGK